jgi:hypothetical protein
MKNFRHISDNDLMNNYRNELESEVTRRIKELKHALEMIKAVSLDTIYRLFMVAEYKDEILTIKKQCDDDNQ